MSLEGLSRRSVILGAALAPGLAVLVARAVAPLASPATAGAQTAAPGPIEPVRPLTAPVLTGKQAALAAALKGRESTYRSPFVVPRSEASRDLLLDPKGGGARRAEFEVSAVVGGTEVMAMINRAARREGDGLGGGWTLVEIDAEKRCVTIEHPEHGRVTLYVKTREDVSVKRK